MYLRCQGLQGHQKWKHCLKALHCLSQYSWGADLDKAVTHRLTCKFEGSLTALATVPSRLRALELLVRTVARDL